MVFDPLPMHFGYRIGSRKIWIDGRYNQHRICDRPFCVALSSSSSWQDILFLESKIEAEYRERIALVSEFDALSMLNRFLTPAVAQAAMQHSSALVRDYALSFLRELAAAGNPFASDILENYSQAGGD